MSGTHGEQATVRRVPIPNDPTPDAGTPTQAAAEGTSVVVHAVIAGIAVLFTCFCCMVLLCGAAGTQRPSAPPAPAVVGVSAGNVEEPEEVKSVELVGPPSGDAPPQVLALIAPASHDPEWHAKWDAMQADMEDAVDPAGPAISLRV
eukprot:gnl/TRDRNA2_/TRDRNA2_128911_c1_seq1.p2 gnl/TRDRNA2_/TRDRNA2_128911_c1~~gnl/TRDRNA2_/TRDRNA2_128911_c1_seq1.p2  ORF type:complete len:158 (+),score=23.87 gnl/TRDRNA2_/TRDRNA2_128911_c1_seq1:36-476(+)